jgi:hypothetical protein
MSVKVTVKTKTKTKTKPAEKKPAEYSFFVQEVKQRLEQQLQKIEGGYYAPNQNYTYLTRAGKKSGIESAADVIRGIHESVQTPKPTTEEDSKELASKLRGREAKALKKYAEANGLVMDAEAFTRKWERTGMIGGGEHAVIIEPHGADVIKKRKLWEHETAFGALNKLMTHNEIVPEAPYTFQGIMNNKEASLVYTQPSIRALTNESAMNALGLTEDEKSKILHAQFRDTVGSQHNFLKEKGRLTKLPPNELDAAITMILNPEFEHISEAEILHHMKGKGFHPDIPAINDLAAGYMLGSPEHMGKNRGASSSIPMSISIPMGDTSVDPFKFDKVQHNFSQEEINSYVMEHMDSFIDMIPFKNTKTGKQVRDLKPLNFVRRMDGELVLIDPMILPDIKPQHEKIKDAIDALTV